MPLNRPFQLPWPVTVGDAVPSWRMPSSLGKELDIGDFVGRPLVMLFLPPDDAAASRQAALGFKEVFGEFQQLGVNVVAVSTVVDPVDKHFAGALGLQFPFLADTDGSVTRAYGAVQQQDAGGRRILSPARKTFVLDPGLRVLRADDRPDPERHAREVLEFVRGFVSREQPRHVTMQAPVLLIPNVLSPEFCRELIHVWETEGNEDSGFMKEINGQTVGVLDYGHKIRRDHYLTKDTPVRKKVMHSIFHRVKPEIMKAHHFDVTRFEDFRIVCYDASKGGYFRPHRDNTTSGTAHRTFAMTLNLNEGEYEGGYLRFPEFGPHLYRPRTGEAVIFSCSLLHEATDLTAGRRFVLLSFFYGEAQARMREEIARRSGAEYRSIQPTS